MNIEKQMETVKCKDDFKKERDQFELDRELDLKILKDYFKE